MFPGSNISLFSPQAIGEKHNRALLIQFLLFEIVEAHRAIVADRFDRLLTSHPRFFPYDWSNAMGYLNKLQEHSSLLAKSFADHKQAVKNFEKTLSKELASLSGKRKISKEKFEMTLQKIYTSLEPLIEICRENENLLFFMLKNRDVIDALVQNQHLYQFLLKIHPCGLETLGEKMCDRYHQRGFFSQIAEFKHLLTELSHV
jgi:hypothetical protein